MRTACTYTSTVLLGLIRRGLASTAAFPLPTLQEAVCLSHSHLGMYILPEPSPCVVVVVIITLLFSFPPNPNP